jgi:hypothetical protein
MNSDIIWAIGRSGQSLAFGAEGNPVIQGQSTYPRALMLGSSVHSGYDGGTPLPLGLQLQPLKSTLVESIDMGWANHAFGHSKRLLPQTAFFYHGLGGYGYSSMRRGTAPFLKGLEQLKRIVALATEQGKRVVVPCCDWISGESDHAYWNGYIGATDLEAEQTYTNWMLQYHRDLNEAFKSITGQGESIKLIWCQTSSHTFYHQYTVGGLNAPDRPTTALVMSKLAQQYPDRFILAGAKYHLPYATNRSVHLSAAGYEKWGRKRGQLFLQSIVDQDPWQAVAPIRAFFKSPNVVQVDYQVMFAPLVLDTSVVTNPGNYGFQYLADGGNKPNITNVLIDPISKTSVLVEFDRPPKGLNRAIGYAYNNADSSTYGENLATGNPRSMGAAFGPRGCLRDSDPTTSFGATMHNYAIHSYTPITSVVI